MLVENFFHLSDEFKEKLKSLPSPFLNQFAETIYYRTYSRLKDDGKRECWADTIIRVTEGIMSIYIDHSIKNGIEIVYDNDFAQELAMYMYHMKVLPAGRPLYSLGTLNIYEKGGMFLYNCTATYLQYPVEDFSYLFFALICGAGCGIDGTRWDGKSTIPDKENSYTYKYCIIR